MAKWEQETAEKIGSALFRLEAVMAKTKGTPRGVKIAIGALHKVLEDALKEHAPTLGIDVQPFTGSGDKPPSQP